MVPERLGNVAVMYYKMKTENEMIVPIILRQAIQNWFVMIGGWEWRQASSKSCAVANCDVRTDEFSNSTV